MSSSLINNRRKARDLYCQYRNLLALQSNEEDAEEKDRWGKEAAATLAKAEKMMKKINEQMSELLCSV